MDNGALKVMMALNAAIVGIYMFLCGIRVAKGEKPMKIILNAATAAIAAATLVLNYRTYRMNLEED